jgi:tripartite-type tricarboxylate transporter receptor subunit TctC
MSEANSSLIDPSRISKQAHERDDAWSNSPFWGKAMSLVRRRFLQLAGAALAAASATPAASLSYPTRPIRLIVPVAAGGPVDVITRLIALKLGERWGSQFYVENLPAGAGNVATGLAAKAPPDGHTAAAVTTGLAINPSLYAHVPYDPIRDFAPLTMIGASPHVLVVDPALPVESVQQLIALVRGTPGKYSYASPGTGQSGQLAAEMFRLACALDLAHVPFNGATPAIASTIAGQTQIAFMSLAAAAASIRGGKLRALAVTSSRRSAIFPEIPIMAEAGVPDQESAFWQGLVFPAGIPPALIERWHGAVVEILVSAEVRERLAAMSLEVVANTPEQFGAHIKSEIAKWRRVIAEAKIGRLDR